MFWKDLEAFLKEAFWAVLALGLFFLILMLIINLTW
jgi:hypothetical protein